MQLTVIPRLLAVMAAVVLFVTPGVAQAYMGPGLGIGAFTAVLGVIGSIFLGIVSIVWYPVKRLLRRLKRSQAEAPKDKTAEDA